MQTIKFNNSSKEEYVHTVLYKNDVIHTVHSVMKFSLAARYQENDIRDVHSACH